MINYNAHAAIITRDEFDTLQELLKKDTRAAKKGDVVYPLSGFIVCGDCGSAMVRKTNTKDGKKYYAPSIVRIEVFAQRMSFLRTNVKEPSCALCAPILP